MQKHNMIILIQNKIQFGPNNAKFVSMLLICKILKIKYKINHENKYPL